MASNVIRPAFAHANDNAPQPPLPPSRAMDALLSDIDLVSPFGRGIEANSCLAETRAALAFFRQHYGELPWGVLAVQGRA